MLAIYQFRRIRFLMFVYYIHDIKWKEKKIYIWIFPANAWRNSGDWLAFIRTKKLHDSLPEQTMYIWGFLHPFTRLKKMNTLQRISFSLNWLENSRDLSSCWMTTKHSMTSTCGEFRKQQHKKYNSREILILPAPIGLNFKWTTYEALTAYTRNGKLVPRISHTPRFCVPC